MRAFAQRPELIGHAQEELADGFHALRQRRGLLIDAAKLFLDMRIARGLGYDAGANHGGRHRDRHESTSPN
jgi:hypothetical protein